MFKPNALVFRVGDDAEGTVRQRLQHVEEAAFTNPAYETDNADSSSKAANGDANGSLHKNGSVASQLNGTLENGQQMPTGKCCSDSV